MCCVYMCFNCSCTIHVEMHYACMYSHIIITMNSTHSYSTHSDYILVLRGGGGGGGGGGLVQFLLFLINFFIVLFVWVSFSFCLF